jgi:hypothetical protein
MIQRIAKHIDVLSRKEKELLDFGFEYSSFGQYGIAVYSDEDRTTYEYNYFIDYLVKYSQVYSMVYAVKLYIHVFDDRVEIEVGHKTNKKFFFGIDKISKDFLQDMIDYFKSMSIDDLENSETEQSYEDRNEKDSYVYLMKNERNGYIKIGKSNNPKYREKTLQSEEPEISLIFKKNVINPSTKEKNLHKKYSDKRIRGEWFDLTEQDISDIKKEIT